MPMAAMRREKQYDMFDVATGACSLEDYLCQRYSENDLCSSFWIDEKDEVDELRAPKPLPDGQPGTEPEVVPIQGPRAPKSKTPFRPAGPPEPPIGLKEDKEPAPTPAKIEPTTPPKQPLVDGQDTLVASDQGRQLAGAESFRSSRVEPAASSSDSFQASSVPASESDTEVAPPAGPPSMQDLLAQFHAAREDFNQRNASETATGENAPPSSET